MNKNILELARTCLDCQQSKISRHVKTYPNFFEPPEARFAQVHIDLIGPLPESEGYKYCLTCIDRFSRWPEAIPIKDITADTVTKAFYTGWISRFGSPEIICTDQGTQFESELFKSFMHIFGCKRNRTTSKNPAANGLIERWHRSLKSSIMCHITEESGNEVFNRWRRTVRDTIQDVARSDWVDILPTVLLGLRTSIRQALDASPAEFLYGTAIRTPGDFIEPRKTPLETALKTKDAKIFLRAHQERMNQLRPVPVKHKQKAKPFAYPELENCTHVFLREEDTTSLERPYSGPHKVTKRKSDRVYEILRNGKAVAVSIERLRPAHLLIEDPNSILSPAQNTKNVHQDHHYGDKQQPSSNIVRHDHTYGTKPANPAVDAVKKKKKFKKHVTFNLAKNKTVYYQKKENFFP